MSELWYYALNGQTYGPVTAAEIKRLAAVGELTRDALIWPKGVDPSLAVEAAGAIDGVSPVPSSSTAVPRWLEDARRVEAAQTRKPRDCWPLPGWLSEVQRAEATAVPAQPRQWPLPDWLKSEPQAATEGVATPSAPAPEAPAPAAVPAVRSWWPGSQDYNEAVQNPRLCFQDAELHDGAVTTNAIGLPMPRSGSFADVYEFHATAGNRWALKCFTRQVPNLQERYAAISAYLKQVDLPFMVDFHYLDPGIKVRGLWHPLLKMDWVEGLTLNEFVARHADNHEVLHILCQIWLWLARKLREAGLGHCDLQHGNVLLVQPKDNRSLAIRLIDYDGMFVPALAQHKSGELGHPAYQHPQRLREGSYCLEVDRFSHLVIYTALRALIVGGRGLWQRYDNGDNLLFRPQDFVAPKRSPLIQQLQRFNDPQVQTLTAALIEAAQKPLVKTPQLDALIAKV